MSRAQIFDSGLKEYSNHLLKDFSSAAFAALVLAALFCQPADASSCRDQLQSFNATSSQVDAESIIDAYEGFYTSNSCSAAEREKVRRATASRIFRIAYQGVTDGLSADAVDQLLNKSLSIAPTWRTLSFYGTRDHAAGRYAQAAQKLQSALALIEDTHETPKAPSGQIIDKLHRMASESLLLADRFVAPPQVRGVSSGVFAQRVRGFSVRRTPLPISFETSSTEFTASGLGAVKALLVALRSQGNSPIEIVGHADERGGDDFNMWLSLKRALTVRRWLLDNGLQREVRASGRGESEPMLLISANAYNQEQIWQLNRRVELLREPISN